MREFTALINPVSGGGEAAARLRPVLAALRALGSEVVLERTRSAAHASELAFEAAGNGRVVLAVGGDGLVRDAAGAVVRAGGTLGIVPAGRGNDFARTLGLPAEPDRLAALLHEGAVRELDVLDADGVIVPGNVYAGIDSKASVLINANRWVPAALLYRIAPVLAFLRWKPAEYTLEIDGEQLRARANTVVLANSGAYGHGLRIVPPAVLDDGRADVLVVGEGPRSAIVRFMREAKTGSHVRRPEVSLRTAREIRMRVDRPVPLCADGDVIGELPVTVRLRPGALRVITG
ncbi:diacylglycerol/lipid kinase family protein [Sciscionella marina]|uniref:diacylglycerol/lipid kinase family protein n=1 Tax=Sciscionella marina TaxID=508770 RepID=UPI00036AE87A|nr:diacylglycerol kinase family protein [Sciscionella marina]